LQRAVSCVTRDVLIEARDFRLVQLETLKFPNDVANLRGAPSLKLSVLHSYSYVQPTHGSGSIDIRTMAYFYRLDSFDGTELVAFHWHPDREGQPDFPHLHVASRPGPPQIQRKHHVPTGRASLESVVRFAIQELGVRPLRPDWEHVLDAGQREFDARRSW
jgi:hypothetical protein